MVDQLPLGMLVMYPPPLFLHQMLKLELKKISI